MLAITRRPGTELNGCALTHLDRVPIDVEAAAAQHAAYEDALRTLGVEVISLPPLAGHPDAVFVEDTAVVLDEVAVIARPGAASRRGEVASIREVLAGHRPLVELPDGVALDGGDVLRIGRTLFVGRTSRTDAAGAAALAAALAPHGYAVVGVPLDGCLHLKTGACAVDDDRVLVNPAWIVGDLFGGRERIAVDPDEPLAANLVRVGRSLLYPIEHNKTLERLNTVGVERVVTVPNAELAKAEGGLTCLSLLID